MAGVMRWEGKGCGMGLGEQNLGSEAVQWPGRLFTSSSDCGLGGDRLATGRVMRCEDLSIRIRLFDFLGYSEYSFYENRVFLVFLDIHRTVELLGH